MFEQPYYIAPHAVIRFQERVADVPTRIVRLTIQAALQGYKNLIGYHIYDHQKCLVYKARYQEVEYYIPVMVEKHKTDAWKVVPTILSPKMRIYNKDKKSFAWEGEQNMRILTPTQLIRTAALTTGKVKRIDGKVITYKDIEIVPVQDELCWLCGGETNNQGVPVKKAIKPTFTNIPIASELKSKTLCAGCAFCLSFVSLRHYSIVATEKNLQHPSRAELRGILLDPPDPPFVICVAVSGQKWLHIKSQIAYTKNYFPVQMEDTTVYVDHAKLKSLLAPIEELYSGGFRKMSGRNFEGEIETGRYDSHKILAFGIERWQKLEDKINNKRGQRAFNLALFIAQKKEEQS